MAKYKKENCQSSIRRKVELATKALSATIIVAGQHSYEWTITLTKSNGYNSSRIFPGRVAALGELSRLKKQFHELGDCKL